MIDKPKNLFSRLTLADTGRSAIAPRPLSAPETILGELGAMGLLMGRTLHLVFTAKTDRGDTWRIAHGYTNGSATFIITSMAFVGMIMVYQSTEQAARAIGDTTLVGASFMKLLVRVLGPTVTGMLLACRVGAGIAAEIGAMSVTDQLDAMRMCSAEPVEVLMVPRVRAGIIASLVLVVVGSAASAYAGLATSLFLYSTSSGTYWNFELVGLKDVVQGLAKAFAYGLAVPVVAGAYGLAARGGARGVGQATTEAVVGASFAIVALDSIISLIAHIAAGQ